MCLFSFVNMQYVCYFMGIANLQKSLTNLIILNVHVVLCYVFLLNIIQINSLPRKFEVYEYVETVQNGAETTTNIDRRCSVFVL